MAAALAGASRDRTRLDLIRERAALRREERVTDSGPRHAPEGAAGAAWPQ
jgi:hypothetical protein